MFSALLSRSLLLASFPFPRSSSSLSNLFALSSGRRGISHLKDDKRSPPLIVPLSIRQEVLGFSVVSPGVRGSGSLPIFSNIHEYIKKDADEIYSGLYESEEGGDSLLFSGVETGDNEEEEEVVGHSLESTKRKRVAKMNKHKYRKRLKKSRFLRRSLGQA